MSGRQRWYDPLRPDFLIEANTYTWGVNEIRTDRCKVVAGVLACNWAVGGGIPGSPGPFPSGGNSRQCVRVDLSGSGYEGISRYAASAYSNAWSIYSYPPSVANVAEPFFCRSLPTTYAVSVPYTVPQVSTHCGGYQSTQTRSCQVGIPGI